MYKSLPLLLLILCCSLSACTQQNSGRIIFYNTENFFDTIKDPKTDDGEFTPQGSAHWTAQRYQHKLDNIAKVLAAMAAADAPIAIGLSEMENKKVSQDLAAQPALKKYDLGVIEQDSPDPRGIDVALLYSRKLFNITGTEFINVSNHAATTGTRDILYVKGIARGVELHLFVNHWPSRRDGKEASEHKRLAVAAVLKNRINRILAANKDARIIIMGDLNDNPTDNSIKDIIGATEPLTSLQRGQLYNLMAKPYRDGKFTLKYHAENDVFDQMIVTENLLELNTAAHVKSNEGNIFKEQWMLFNHPKYGPIPNRTYSGPRYYGGFSDHLPVYIDLLFAK